MTATTQIDLDDRKHQNRGCNWHAIWEACTSTVFAVVDEDGVNMADSKIRHFSKGTWLYVDDVDGYQLMDQDDVEKLELVAID